VHEADEPAGRAAGAALALYCVTARASG